MDIRALTGVIAVFALSLAACGNDGGPAGSGGNTVACDRECLMELTDTYLAALVAGNTSDVSLAADVAFVENITRMMPGEGLWETATSGPTDFAIYVPDIVQQQAGFLGVMMREGEDGNEPVLLALRLKLENGEITEAEHLIAGINPDNMQRLQVPRAGLASEVLASSRQDYADLVAIGLSYYDALDDNDGSLMPFADDCQRHENGMITAGPEGLDPDRMSIPTAPLSRACVPLSSTVGPSFTSTASSIAA